MAILAAACGSPALTPGPPLASESAVPSGAPSVGADYHDRNLSPEVRASALLAQMTVDEKIGQMTQLESGSVDPSDVAPYLLGSVLSGGDGTPPQNNPDAWYQMVGAYQEAALGTRLVIPILVRPPIGSWRARRLPGRRCS